MLTVTNEYLYAEVVLVICIASNTAPALSPESTLFVEYCTWGPSSTTPVLLELCVGSFDTAPPPQDLLAGLLYTALSGVCRLKPSYCLGIGLDELVARRLSSCVMTVMMTPRSGVSVDDDEVDGVSDKVVIPGLQWTTAFGSIYIWTAGLL
ncbi:uncharacterized protein UHO2_00196 [Ustilago hordei]|uniref:uncharacterized protein n=1 Tax=Ustilago hordei TaxID=120017 RepID=UPI001A4E0ABD|nr:uncharacterized protein UHO2_00196 [Ustilago hordei]SYW81692.1 uncharacterized protein UHO2_00196 [Ustilago hordei]